MKWLNHDAPGGLFCGLNVRKIGGQIFIEIHAYTFFPYNKLEIASRSRNFLFFYTNHRLLNWYLVVCARTLFQKFLNYCHMFLIKNVKLTAKKGTVPLCFDVCNGVLMVHKRNIFILSTSGVTQGIMYEGLVS